MTSNAAVLPSHRALVAKLAQRPVISVNRLLLATTAYLAATQNGALWGLVRRTLPAEPSLADGSLILALVSILLAGTFTTLALLSPRPVIKPALGLLVVTAVVCNYFMTRYGVVIDTHMWVNVQHTNEREASELLSAGLLRQLLLWAAVPMLLLWRVQVSSQAWGAEWGTRLLYLLIVWAVALTAVGLQYKHVSIWLRTHSEIAKYPNPFYPVGSAIKFAYRGSSRRPRLGNLPWWVRTLSLGKQPGAHDAWCWWWVKPRGQITSHSTAMRETPIHAWPR